MYGSKIDNLNKLRANGINVPDFVVVTQEDYDNNNFEVIENLISGLYAVRSSCNLEDGNINSFAGQFDTYLNVEAKDLKRKIADCFSSLHSDNVLEYIKQNEISISEIKMNVIVQQMINSEKSGVIFTSNPQGLLNETVIVVANGLGENVVQDKGKTTSYYYNTTDKVYYYEGDNILSPEEIDNIIKESEKIKTIIDEYSDIEFAVAENNLYFLQARKITTISDDNLTVLDNSNIVESYPNISSPLTISFVNTVYSNVFKRLVLRVLNNRSQENKLEGILNNMTASCNGRVYYKISNWYSLLKYLPFSKKIIPIWQDMMGVKTADTNSTDTNISKMYKLKICINYLNLLFHSQKRMKRLNFEFINIEKYYRSHKPENLSDKEIILLYKVLEEKVLNNWDITLVNDMYAFIYTGILKNHLKKKYKDNYEELTNDYISGISNIESLKPIKELINLAYNEKNYSAAEFAELKSDYINLYGDRCLEELKLESKTFRTNPELLDQKIKEYQQDKRKLEALYTNISSEKSKKVKDDIIIKLLSAKIESGIKNREISRLNRSRIYGIVREMFLTIAQNMVKKGIINEKEDIFYLEIKEIFNSDNNVDYKKIITERKENYRSYNLLPAYSRLVFHGDSFDKVINNAVADKYCQNTDFLQGTPCSFGICEGEALVIKDINEINDTKNKILVTKMTDPGWVFLIANSKGVISEKGSLLSHTSIISRELKIPSIVGVVNLTEIIQTGDYIKMDGNTGKIKILKKGQYDESC